MAHALALAAQLLATLALLVVPALALWAPPGVCSVIVVAVLPVTVMTPPAPLGPAVSTQTDSPPTSQAVFCTGTVTLAPTAGTVNWAPV